MPVDEVEVFLLGQPLSDRQRAAAWDAVYRSADDADLQRRLTALDFGDHIKAELWEYAHRPSESAQAPEGSAAGRFVSGVGEILNPVTIAKGLYQAVRHPIQTGEAVLDAQMQQFDKSAEAQREGRMLEAAGHRVAGAIPLLGPMAAAIGEQMGSGDVAGGLGKGTALLASTVAAPAVVRGGAKVIGAPAKALVRSAIKPTVAAARSQAGASVTGINAQANRLVEFIVENGITSRAKAQAIVSRVEGQLQQLATAATTATDAPARAQRYLSALMRSAAKQGLPGDDVAAIRAKAVELIQESPLAEDVTTMVSKPSPTGLVTANGQPVMVPTPVTTRALRTDVMPDEALELARGSSRWGNRKAWGEQKGASREASKAVERAARDAFKEAVPEAKPLLKTQGQAIETGKVLDRMEFRQANREPISPFDVTTAAVEMGTTGAPVLALARHVLRESKLQLGVWAKRLERAIATHDEATAAVILDRFGYGRASQQATSPSGSRTNTEPLMSTP